MGIDKQAKQHGCAETCATSFRFMTDSILVTNRHARKSAVSACANHKDSQAQFGFGTGLLVLAPFSSHSGHSYTYRYRYRCIYIYIYVYFVLSLYVSLDVSILQQGCAPACAPVALTLASKPSPCLFARVMAADDDGTALDAALEALMLEFEVAAEVPAVLPSFDGQLALLPLQDQGPPSIRRRLSIDWATKAPSWVLPPGASRAVSSLTSRQKSDFRDQWCLHLLRRMPHLKATSYNDGLARAKELWQEQPSDHKTGWFLHMADARHPAPPFPAESTFGDRSGGSSRRGGGTASAAAGCAPSQMTDERLHGFLLTYNGSWGAGTPEVDALAMMQGTHNELVAAVRHSAFYDALWREFVTELTLKSKRDWPQLSCKMELSLKRSKPQNLVHFHVALSNFDKPLRLGALGLWEFRGAFPHVRGTKGRGKALQRQLDAAHYYVQAPKFGSVFSETNYTRFQDFLVEATSIMSLWRFYKLSDEVAIEELLRGRVRGIRNHIAEISFVQEQLKQRREAALREVLEVRLSQLQKPPRCLPAVTEWLQLYTDGFGSRSRFPFLVLHGPSQYGKTSFAVSIFGPAATLVVSCQNVQQPNLTRFDRTLHKCLVFDECEPELVLNNRQLFQAGSTPVMLGQSPTQQHAYQIFAYAIPMIVCTNIWSREADPWLDANSIYIPVSAPLWRDENALADM